MAEVRPVVQPEEMRLLLAAATAALVLCLPALGAGAGPDPGRLVLRASDVPQGFVVDGAETGRLTNEHEWREEPQARPVLRKAGRVTGYESRFERGLDSIASRVDLLRGPAGSRLLLDYFDSEMRKSGIRGLHRSRLAIGDEGWLYGDRKGDVVTFVVWRSGRVFSAVVGAGVARPRTLSLARVQQRRIAAAFR
jgi:hypothetical protein